MSVPVLEKAELTVLPGPRWSQGWPLFSGQSPTKFNSGYMKTYAKSDGQGGWEVGERASSEGKDSLFNNCTVLTKTLNMFPALWKDLFRLKFLEPKTQKQPKYPQTDKWINKMWYISTTEYYSVIKKEWNNGICSNMDRPREGHTEWSKSNRKRQISHDIAYMWNLKKNDANELIYKTEIEVQI